MGRVLNFGHFKDTLRSFVSGMGGPADKSASLYYDPAYLAPFQLLNMYKSSWVAKKIVNIPAFDAFREWRSWQAEDDQIELIENEEQRLGLQQKLLNAKIRSRLYGGCAIYLSTGETATDTPLDPTRVGKGGLKFLTVIPRTKLQPGPIQDDPLASDFGTPTSYQINRTVGEPVVIHNSRLVLFPGENCPADDLVQSWGDSALTACLEAIKNADSTAANIASLVFEAKVDVIKIPQMMASLTDPHYEQTLMERFALANRAKGLSATVLLDAEEEYEQKTADFGTLPDILMAFFQVVSGAADIPMTRFLGQSPGGLNATGDADMRNYYDRIKSMQNVEIRPAINNLDECLIRSALGSRPPEIHYTWTSLWQLSETERVDVGLKAAQIITELNNSALFPQEALAKSGTNMLTELAVMPGLAEEVEAAGGFEDYFAELEADSVDLTTESQANAAGLTAEGNARPIGKAGNAANGSAVP